MNTVGTFKGKAPSGCFVHRADVLQDELRVALGREGHWSEVENLSIIRSIHFRFGLCEGGCGGKFVVYFSDRYGWSTRWVTPHIFL